MAAVALAASAPSIAERVADCRLHFRRGNTVTAAILARHAGIALRESGLDPDFAVNPFEGDDESDLAHAFAEGLVKGRRPVFLIRPWSPIPGCTHAAHAAGTEL